MNARTDLMIGRAAADVAVHRAVDVSIARRRHSRQAAPWRSHDLPGLAVAALRHVEFAPGGAHCLGRPCRRAPSIVTIFICRGVGDAHLARADRRTIGIHCTSAAKPVVAPLSSTRESVASRRAHSNGVSGSTSSVASFAIDREIIGHPHSSASGQPSLEILSGLSPW